MIDYEAEKYADIVQADFRDHYYNNTYKAIYHMKWVFYINVSSLKSCFLIL